MRPYLLRSGLTMLIVSALALSCREEHPLENIAPDSPERPVIDGFFSRLKPADQKDSLELSALRSAINFSRISRHTLTNNEDVLIADVGKFGFEDVSTFKALFFIQNGEVVRSNLVAFSDLNADHNNIILSIARRRFDPQSYNGRITYYNIYRNVLFFNVVEDGRLTTNGVAQSRKSSKTSSTGRSQGCTDWFLITTYHYGGGGTSTDELYLTTTCGGECQTVRMQGRTSCGGGGYEPGYGSYGPAMPTYPADGDRYTFTDPDGKSTTYIYNASSMSWAVYLVILPEYTVQSNPLSYPSFISDSPPMHNTSVNGPDGLLYIYDAWSASWEAGEHFLSEGGDDGLMIRDRTDFFRCFNRSRPATLTIYVDQPKAGSAVAVAGTDVGHSWLALTQTIGRNTITRVFGYYPVDGAGPVDPRDAGTLVNDAGHEYDVSVTVPLSPASLSLLLNYTINSLPATYDLNTFNCTDFVVDACNAAGVTLPENSQSWLGGGGLCPGQLGEDLRTYDIPSKAETRDLDGGHAPADSGC